MTVARLGGTVGRRTRLVAGLLRPTVRNALDRPVTGYKASGYWLDYRSGFVRRGLPGEVLRRVAGGAPTYSQVERTAMGLARASALSVVPVAVEAALRAPGEVPRTVAAGLLLSSPLTCGLLLRDAGRYDAVGVLVLALMSTGRALWLPLPLPMGAALLAGAVTAAVASEEFLLAVLTPTAIAAVRRLADRHGASQTARRWILGGVLGPGALVAGASLLVPAPRDAVAAARAEAARAGAEPPGAMGDSLSAVDRGFVENLAFFRLFRPTAVGLSLGLWAGLYTVTADVIGKLLGAGADGRYRLAASAHALVATALSAAGVDFRRWWGLALTGLVSTVVLVEPTGPPEPVSVAAIAAAVALAVAGVAFRDPRVHPWGPLRVDRAPPLRP
ncbi:hypothetical protein SAMN05660657_00439 [Geodermatophilus amargosae]|uniref:Dolichyl-phosphate-mannose-protein mannosyltransferase n=1 Tax=Geodermatophilus amargosae TaxID=1296565 RepID=A0A1I6XDH7_9ACTN|nr:hypothetical protein [Geodermatophilus amargosae]SFT36360.1 hypothetical protein SAMN05660657_00439 [Geodermatophilus amargosae]